ncbi:hypothetical protein GGF42_003920 [Coemansia sp. RSA 2424]|nr:hypothetical protein GGF42_003920 [Coemansia sp. RSA 2424]
MLRSALRPARTRNLLIPSLLFKSVFVHPTAPRRGLSRQRFDSNDDNDGSGGVEPHVSLYARVATAVFIAGVAYYAYTEYGSALARRHLPWPAATNNNNNNEDDRDNTAEGANGRARRKQKQRDDSLAPKSTLSPHEQVRWAWTHPGLYVVGSNKHGLVDPMHPGGDSSAAGLRAAVPGLEGRLLRGAAFAETHAAAIDADGCLYQWGSGFTASNAEPHMPQCTLSDPALAAVAASRDYIVLLDRKSRIRLVRGNNNNTSSADGLKPASLPFEPRLGWRENVVAVSAGEDHIAATTDSGHVYTCALGPSGNDRSQLGHGPAAAQQQPPPLVLRRIEGADTKFAAAVCGGRHTLLLTAEGDVWGCGANDFGQLAMGKYSDATRTIPELTPIRTLWGNTVFQPRLARATAIAAGAKTSYFQIAHTSTSTNSSNKSHSDQLHLEVLAAGCGIDGQLGNGSFAHMLGKPTRISALSGVFENDPATGQRRPVGVRVLSANGSSDHVVAVCDNHTNVVLDKSALSASKPSLFGYDVVVWGSNSSGQCIPNRKHRFAEPEHPPPLYTSSSPVDQMSTIRLQAAPRQWVSTANFKNRGSEKENSRAGEKKYLVEQEFVTGPGITVAFLKSV